MTVRDEKCDRFDEHGWLAKRIETYRAHLRAVFLSDAPLGERSGRRFLAASRDGDFDALLAVLDPDVVLRADPAAVQEGAAKEVRGAPAVADTFSGRARLAQPALVDGAAGAVWDPGGRPPRGVRRAVRIRSATTCTDGAAER